MLVRDRVLIGVGVVFLDLGRVLLRVGFSRVFVGRPSVIWAVKIWAGENVWFGLGIGLARGV